MGINQFVKRQDLSVNIKYPSKCQGGERARERECVCVCVFKESGSISDWVNFQVNIRVY